MERSALEKACFEGKTASQGGLSIAGIRAALQQIFPSADLSGSRLDLEDKCASLLRSKSQPKLGVEIDQFPIFYAGHPTKETRILPQEKYCSCIFSLLGKHGDPQLDKVKYNAYAICSSSVYKKARGLPGPGAVSCRYTRAFLNGLDEVTLFNYAKSKKIASIGTVDKWKNRKAELVDVVFGWLHGESKSGTSEEFDQWLAQQD